MTGNKCTCPHCNNDISSLVNELVKLRIKQINAEKARKSISPEQRKKNTEQSQQRLKKWREENPEQAKAAALKASHARTAETFARQRETVKETVQKKAIKFADLLFAAREAGQAITPELERDLLRQAAEIIREENKLAKKKSKAAGKY